MCGRAGGRACRRFDVSYRCSRPAAERLRRDRQRRCWRCGDGARRPGSRRLGDCHHDRSADAVHPHRRDRRPGTLCAARSAAGDVFGLGARLRACGFAARAGHAGEGAEPDRRAGADAARRGRILSCRLLVLAAADSGEERISRHRTAGQRHLAQYQDAAGLHTAGQVRRLLGVSSAGQQSDAGNSESVGHVRLDGRRLGAASPVGSGRSADGRRTESTGSRAHAEDVCRVDRLDQRRRDAVSAAAPAGNRAQRRNHRMGLGRSEVVPAR